MIQRIEEILKEENSDYIHQLFNRELTISVKRNGSSFCAKREENKWTFWKKGGEYPITDIDRTLVSMYEMPIEHFNNLDKFIFYNFPDYTKIHCDIIHGHSMNDSVLALNKIEMKIGNKYTNIRDKNRLDKYSLDLCILPSPILFQGRMTEKQKTDLIDWLYLHIEEVPVEALLQILEINHLVSDSNEIIFDFYDKFVKQNSIDGKSLNFKLLFGKKIQKNAVEEEKILDDMYSIILCDIVEYMMDIKISTFNRNGSTFEKKYINYISDCFNSFIDTYGSRYDNIDLPKPEFMLYYDFELNLAFIENRKTLELVSSNKIYEEIYKIFIATFKKKKKINVVTKSIITKNIINFQNNLVDEIFNYLSINVLDESNLSIYALLETYDESINEQDGTASIDTNDSSLDSSSLDVGRVVSFWKNSFDSNFSQQNSTNVSSSELEQKDKKEGKKIDINIIVSKFQPFHNGHLDLAKQLYRNNHKKIILVVLPTNKEDKYIEDKSIHKQMLGKIVSEYENLFERVCYSEKTNIHHILEFLSNKYSIQLIGNNYTTTADTNYIKKGINKSMIYKQEKAENDHHSITSKKVWTSIEDGNYGKFKEYMPKELYEFWQFLK